MSGALVVRDRNGTEYRLGRLLGEGGQGRVFEVEGQPRAVKLLSAPTRLQRDRLEGSIARIRRLHLDKLPLARPQALLAPPHVGYVMELLTGMIPLGRLLHPPRGGEDFLAWYLESGGTVRRLRLLARLGEVLGELHGRGLGYGDLSPENVLVSASADHAEVWLIDCDNIHAGVSPRAYYTPGYAAPELFRGHLGADSLTDAWSFATLAFEALTVLHPFDGDRVHDGDPEEEERAHRGELEWVDAESGSNAALSRGLPRELVLSRPLRKLAEDCFGASRLDRARRPGVSAWTEQINSAADQTLTCAGCPGSFMFNQRLCPWCDTPRPDFVLAEVRRVDPDAAPRQDGATPTDGPQGLMGEPFTNDLGLVARLAVQAGRPTRLEARHAAPGDGDGRRPLAELQVEGSRLLIVGRPDAGLVLATSSRARNLEGVVREVPVHELSRAWLAPVSPSGVQRVVQFRLQPSGRRS